VEVGVIATVLMSATLLIVVVSTTTPAVISFLLLRGPIAAVMFTITFPLGVVGARAAGVSLSAVAALLNMVWAGSALVGPILAGAITEFASPEASYLVVIVMALAGSAWMATAGRAPRVAREPDCSRTVTGR
jgi:hypothetical protein